MSNIPGDGHTFPPSEGDAHHVDVLRAGEIFNQLSHTLSRTSKRGQAKSDLVTDIERTVTDDEYFDLRDYLQSSNDAQQSAGIKHKHVGVTWEDLEVDVAGGEDFKVC